MGLQTRTLLQLALVAAALLSCAAGQGAWAPVELGLGSVSGSGACGYALSPGDWPSDRLASIDPVQSPFAGGQQQGCGVCLEVQCTAPGCSGSTVVQVSDHCESCGAARVFVSQAAWSQAVQGSSLQQLPGQVRQVACQPPGNLQPQITEYRAGNGGYLKLALQSVAGNGDLVTVEVKGSSQVSTTLVVLPLP